MDLLVMTLNNSMYIIIMHIRYKYANIARVKGLSHMQLCSYRVTINMLKQCNYNHKNVVNHLMHTLSYLWMKFIDRQISQFISLPHNNKMDLITC